VGHADRPAAGVDSLHGLHRIHAAQPSWTERWGYYLASAGLAIGIPSAVLSIGIDPRSSGVGLVGLLTLLGVIPMRAGLVIFGIGVARSQIVPGWTQALLLGSVSVLVISTGAALARADTVQPLLGTVGWLSWAVVSGAVLLNPRLAPGPDPERRKVPLREVGGAFISKATIASAVVSVGVLTLEWEWYVGALVVLLLYAHELGHVIAALVRGVAVHRAPFFLPGLGAFVQTAAGTSHWDDVWVSLGGPLFGGGCALAMKAAGMSQGNAALAHAGDVGLWLNLLNLAPFSPLDGGRVAARTGWFGLVMTVVLGVFLLVQGLDLILLVLIAFGVWQAFVAVGTVRVGWGTQIGVLVVYGGSILLLLTAAVVTGQARWLEAPRPDWLPGISEVFSFMFWYFIAGMFALPYAMGVERGATTRYGLMALFGWTRYVLDGRQWVIPVAGALAASTVGLGGLRWVERFIGHTARRQDPRAGEAAVYAFDCLRRQGRDGDRWLEEITPVLVEGGPEVLGTAYATLRQLGYRSVAFGLLRASLRGGRFSDVLPPSAANNYAWQLFASGEAMEALPYARGAVARDPENSYALGTLGQVLLALGDVEEAEQVLRRSLERRDRSGNRFSLARSLAAQDRISEAVVEAEQALSTTVGQWDEAEPTPDQARAELERWRAQAAAMQGVP
jgi:Zn-dependent protease